MEKVYHGYWKSGAFITADKAHHFFPADVNYYKDGNLLISSDQLSAPCEGLMGSHQYAEQICPHCGVEFCYACCGAQNVDSSPYGDEFMDCPVCGHNVLGEDV